MGNLLLITGGARSGKSRYAEERVRELWAAPGETPVGSVLYVATCEALDDEMRERVRHHQERRPPSWHTLESSESVGARILETAAALPDLRGVLLDCVTLLVSACMARTITDWDHISLETAEQVESLAREEAACLLQAAAQLPCPLLLVTNELGMGLVPEYPAGRLFRDVAGRVNQQLAEQADEVVLCVSGIPVQLRPSRP